MRLSVLDQSPIRSGSSAPEAIAESIALAKLCEGLGYHRYWFAEHHNTTSYAGSCPEILIARVASETSRIRVGSGGIMLLNYSPLKISEQFRMLEVLSPGRVDLGLGRATGSDESAAQMLAYGSPKAGSDGFPAKVAFIRKFLGDDAVPTENVPGIVQASPVSAGKPQLWILGASESSAKYAAQEGLPFCYAYFISREGSEDACAAYFEHFRPSVWCDRPALLLAAVAIVAETDAKAQLLAESRYLWGVQLLSGGLSRPVPFLPPEEARDHPYTAEEREFRKKFEESSFVGAPTSVKSRLDDLARRHNAEELVILTITYDPEARRQSYKLLAEAFGIADGASAEPRSLALT